MCCFLTPMAAAAVATVARKKFPERLHAGWLLMMLWGAVVALVVDHAINGEISIYPPFLTALKSPEQTEIMLREIAVTGTAMTVAVFAFWGVSVAVANLRAKAARGNQPA
ncbi:MAG TPA: hypothetical protein PKG82_02970 [Myxococcota bacterium]|mgnify:FL=1|nr:hypothetical protein [Myxococcota bacterium]